MFKSACVAGELSIVSGMAGRYATALFELAQESDSIDSVGADLDSFEALMKESPDLSRLIRSPVFSTEERSGALSAVLDKAGIGGTTAKFLKVLAANRRLFAVAEVTRGYRAMVAKLRGQASAQVTVAEAPSEANLAAIKDALNSITGKDVTVDLKVDPAIIGGLVVKLGSRMVDDSLRTKLNAIKHAMKEVG